MWWESYKHLISNKRGWNNTFKNAHKIWRILPDFLCKNNRFSACFLFWANAYCYLIWRAWYNSSCTMMAKPIRALELHYPMIQFLTKCDISCYYVIYYNNLVPWSLIDEAEARISPSTSSTRDLGTRWWASLSSDVFWAAHVNRKLAFFSLYTPWCYLICIAKCIYSYRDDLAKYLFKITFQEWKKSTSSWLASLKNVAA